MPTPFPDPIGSFSQNFLQAYQVGQESRKQRLAEIEAKKKALAEEKQVKHDEMYGAAKMGVDIAGNAKLPKKARLDGINTYVRYRNEFIAPDRPMDEFDEVPDFAPELLGRIKEIDKLRSDGKIDDNRAAQMTLDLELEYEGEYSNYLKQRAGTFGGADTITSEKMVEDTESPTGFSMVLLDKSGGVVKKLRDATKEDIEGKAAVQINMGKPASAGQQQEIAEGRANIDALNNLKNLFDKSFVGPAEGRKGMAKNIFGLNPDKQAAFMAATSAFKNTMIKAITGAQMSEPEAARIMKQIPDITDADNVWKAKWEQSSKNLEMLNERRLEVIRQSGLRAPEGGTTKDASDMTDAELDAEIARLKGGR